MSTWVIHTTLPPDRLGGVVRVEDGKIFVTVAVGATPVEACVLPAGANARADAAPVDETTGEVHPAAR